MRTKSRTLPLNHQLDVRVAFAGVQISRRPRPLHRVVFRMTMQNCGTESVRLLGRKWTLRESNGSTRIVEAGKVFNQQPVLTPGSVFSHSGYQLFQTAPTEVEVQYFGTDSRNEPFITPPLAIPRRALRH